ncbi:hypothetical protein ACIRU8_02955 [Streptomyces sp. NPDC101175]|uniref:hypothetical protein n=1 Tax=Streptomyces sp. NPDC101175 TaxID=3366123 RepID=UPI00383321CA
MAQQYKPHEGGQQPNQPPRDANGVQQFAAKTPDPCPPGMIRDPATGECQPEGTTS